MIDPEDPDVVALAPSSNKSKPPYKIRRNEAGILWCECDGYKWRSKCRHLKEYLEGLEVVVKVKILFIDNSDSKVARITTISGLEVPLETFKVGDLTTGLVELEERLSRLTGFAVRIETNME